MIVHTLHEKNAKLNLSLRKLIDKYLFVALRFDHLVQEATFLQRD
jgi:hypothetical protein